MRRNLLQEEIDRKVKKIRALRLSVEQLNAKSEEMRVAIEDFECNLTGLLQTGLKLDKSDRIEQRILAIHRARNGMECFHLKCLALESLDTAYKSLP